MAGLAQRAPPPRGLKPTLRICVRRCTTVKDPPTVRVVIGVDWQRKVRSHEL